MWNFTEYYDISPEISEKIAVWPGDTPFERTRLVDYASGGHYLLSTLKTTVHLGAHADAPNHYHPQGEGIASRDLNYYLGPCQVITLNKPRGSCIVPSDLAGWDRFEKRVLFKTSSYPDPNRWNADFVSLSPELIELLSQHGVILVGIDTPSIDLSSANPLHTHLKVHQENMAVLEGLDLSRIHDGVYLLIALPLKIKDADASPVRAILVPTTE